MTGVQTCALPIYSTKWVEERLDLSQLQVDVASTEGVDALVRRDVTTEVNGRRFSVALWLPEGVAAAPSPAGGPKAAPRRAKSSEVAGSGSGSVQVPMQGTIVKVAVAVGDSVEAGQTVVILEAMKMENAVAATKAGIVKDVRVAAGDSVSAGDVVVVIE